MNSGLSEAIVLVGGKGTRLHTLFPDIPKALVPVKERPFIDYVIGNLTKQGICRIVLAVGYLSQQLIDHLSKRTDVEIIYSAEEEPLGTGGAVKRAIKHINGDRFLALNGDSICCIDYYELYSFHQNLGVDLTVAVTKDMQRMDGGNVEVGKDNLVKAFHEKKRKEAGSMFLNAGVYVFDKKTIELTHAPNVCSLEYDIFPRMVNRRACAGFITDKPVLDIGTPERYLQAKDYMIRELDCN